MYIKIGNKLITTPISQILKTAQSELTNGKLKHIRDINKRNILITCPWHKDGFETNPSCQVLNVTDDPKLEAGTTHCFSCGYTAPLYQTIADLFDQPPEFGQEWLCERFANVFVDVQEYLPPIELDKSKITNPTLSEDILYQYDFYHPYMWHRKLSKEVVDKFRVGYDKERDAITFPVYNEKHNLVMVTARSVNSKRFYIPPGVDKPVYLLYDILERGITQVVVAESQINTLTLRSWGYDSIGLFGTGSYSQLQTLKKSGIRSFILAFDGDDAGRKGASRFKQYMGNEVFITDIKIPLGKDVNDLTKEQFEELLKHS